LHGHALDDLEGLEDSGDLEDAHDLDTGANGEGRVISNAHSGPSAQDNTREPGAGYKPEHSKVGAEWAGLMSVLIGRLMSL
jgi:hypothetical protein